MQISRLTGEVCPIGRTATVFEAGIRRRPSGQNDKREAGASSVRRRPTQDRGGDTAPRADSNSRRLKIINARYAPAPLAVVEPDHQAAFDAVWLVSRGHAGGSLPQRCRICRCRPLSPPITTARLSAILPPRSRCGAPIRPRPTDNLGVPVRLLRSFYVDKRVRIEWGPTFFRFRYSHSRK